MEAAVVVDAGTEAGVKAGRVEDVDVTWLMAGVGVTVAVAEELAADD